MRNIPKYVARLLPDGSCEITFNQHIPDERFQIVLASDEIFNFIRYLQKVTVENKDS